MMRAACIGWILVLAAAAAHGATLSPGAPVEVRILYDHSGSMYPGYRPPGSPERRTRAELGVGYFHESPRFVDWLNDFARRQTIVDGASIGMWTFTSQERFTPDDIRAAHAVVPLAAFDAARAIRNFPPAPGTSTYLTETVDAFTRDFSGLLWLVTDNIVESGAGEPDAGVQTFFRALAERPEIRAVHLLKYTFEERGHTAAIAVYGILVSPRELPPETLRYYDGKFRLLREAKTTRGNPPADLFPGREYLKLKDLRIQPLEPKLRLVLDQGEEGIFREGQTVKLDVEGLIQSYLTQHTVTGARYELSIASPFQPERWARESLGATPLESERFGTFSAELAEPIPPAQSRAVSASIESVQPVEFSPRGAGDWLQLAWNGATVRYTGTVSMAFDDVQVRLEPQRMAGIFGIGHATRAFAFQDVRTLRNVPPTAVPVTFALRTGNSRTVVLLTILALLAAIAAALAFLASRKRSFRIAVSKEPEAVIALRPLTGHDVVVAGKKVGRLSRGFSGYSFEPVTGDASVAVTPKDPGVWDVKAGDTARRLTIRAEGGGTAKEARGTARPAATPSPPPPAPGNAPPPAPGRPTRIGRN